MAAAVECLFKGVANYAGPDNFIVSELWWMVGADLAAATANLIELIQSRLTLMAESCAFHSGRVSTLGTKNKVEIIVPDDVAGGPTTGHGTIGDGTTDTMPSFVGLNVRIDDGPDGNHVTKCLRLIPEELITDGRFVGLDSVEILPATWAAAWNLFQGVLINKVLIRRVGPLGPGDYLFYTPTEAKIRGVSQRSAGRPPLFNLRGPRS